MKLRYELLVALAFLAAMVFVQHRDAADKEEVAREQDAWRPIFSHPIDYDVSVTQSGPGIREPKTRYYKAKGAAPL